MKQMTVWIQSILLCRLDQTENYRAALGTAGSIGKQEILPINHKGLDAALGPDVAQPQLAVFDYR